MVQKELTMQLGFRVVIIQQWGQICESRIGSSIYQQSDGSWIDDVDEEIVSAVYLGGNLAIVFEPLL